jgi:hypothetical protein
MKHNTESFIKGKLKEFREQNTPVLGEEKPKGDPKPNPSPNPTPKPKLPNGEEGEPKSKDKGDLKAKHDRIKGLLGNNVFNHAGVIEKLWGDSEASNRSLFRKKLNRELNDNGVPYEFDDEELSKIANILMDTSKQVTKKLG